MDTTCTFVHTSIPCSLEGQRCGATKVENSCANIFSPKMEAMEVVATRDTLPPQCLFCKACNFDDIWEHFQECKSIPKRGKEYYAEMYKEIVASAERDWKDFVERKFEPHSFRKRWENIVCPYCRKHCKNIFHTFVCKSTPICRRETNKRIALWNGS